MKKALDLIITYFIFLLCAVLAGTFFYSLYLNVLDFIIGQEISLFEFDDIVKSFFYVALCIVFFICPFISYYRVRHTFGFAQTISYVLLCLFTWLILFPGIVKLQKVYFSNFPPSVSISRLSGGYFRATDNNVYYFTRDYFTNLATNDDTTTIIIETTENGKVTSAKIPEDKDFPLYKESYPYKEVSLKKTFQESDVPLPVNFHTLIDAGVDNLEDGFICYLGFLFLAFAICSVYGISNFFEWRLLNTVFIIIFSIGILSLNCLYYSPVFDFIRQRADGYRFFIFLNQFFNESLLCVMNFVIGLIFLISGLLKFIIRNHAKKE